MVKLQPAIKSYIWGGEKLKSLFGKTSDGDIAESWELSVHPDGECYAFRKPFSCYLEEHKYAVDPDGGGLGILIKFIDANSNLSVQVHPDDNYARIHENDNGKTEMWYVIDADDNSGIYCGLNCDVDRDAFIQSVYSGDVEKYLRFIPVKKGDCFLIRPGTVHAICSGCLICEVQQSSNVTYRIYDYNRIGKDGKKRQLHIDKAADVINYKKGGNEKIIGKVVNCGDSAIRSLASCDYFSCKELTLCGQYTCGSDLSFTAVNVVAGDGQIDGTSFSAGDSFFIDCGEKAVLCGNATLILTTK
ncbi:MAG: class I mannose-6-phosphate isomerase [Clostridia bacterium]|nr:class I mannose-6-phosphate isomerase [Clostridia bacterium]